MRDDQTPSQLSQSPEPTQLSPQATPPLQGVPVEQQPSVNAPSGQAWPFAQPAEGIGTPQAEAQVSIATTPSIEALPPVLPPVAKTPLFKKKWVLIVAGIVLLGGGVGLATWLIQGGSTVNSALADSFRQNAPYEYKKALVNVDAQKTFSFHHSLPLPSGKSVFTGSDIAQYIGVFTDPLLQHKALADYTQDGSNTFTVAPPLLAADVKDETANDSVQIAEAGKWGMHAQYYMAQFANLETGEKLEKPIVTPFTVAAKLAAPSVSSSVTTLGDPQLQWSAVEGASKYYVVRIDMNSVDYQSGVILGETEGTEWVQERTSVGGVVTTQNDAFWIGDVAESRLNKQYIDDLGSSNSNLKADAQYALSKFTASSRADVYLGVIAVSDKGYSAIATVDVDSLRAQLPITKATVTAKDTYAIKTSYGSFAELPLAYPVIMADATVMRMPFLINKDDIKVAVDASKTVSYVSVPYRIAGSAFTGEFRVSTQVGKLYSQQISDAIDAEVNGFTDRVATNVANTGVDKQSPLSDPKFANISFSKSKPSVPFKINASNPLTEFLAANLLAGNQYIDASDYLKSEGVYVDPYDAMQEAIAQNPLTLMSTIGQYAYENGRFVVGYGYEDMAKRAADQKEIDDKAKSVTASILKAGMSDKERAVAINAYIVKQTTYDPVVAEILRSPDCGAAKMKLCLIQRGTSIEERKDNWSPAGPLIKGVSVCAGYADAFLLLANHADLEAVYVTGYVSDSPDSLHAWNKVKIDGKWRVIDTTWNDTGGEASNDNYLLLTDTEVQAKRVNKEDKDWMADVLIATYAAK